MSERASLVPLSRSLEAGTAGQTASAAGSCWDNGGTPSLKSLALKVLQRDKGRDNGGTAPPSACPNTDVQVGQDEPLVPLDIGHRPEPLVLRDGRRLWRFRAERIPTVVNAAATRAAVAEARQFGCVLVADGASLMVVEPWLSELPKNVRDGLAANAGTIIALLRGESRVRTDA